MATGIKVLSQLPQIGTITLSGTKTYLVNGSQSFQSSLAQMTGISLFVAGNRGVTNNLNLGGNTYFDSSNLTGSQIWRTTPTPKLGLGIISLIQADLPHATTNENIMYLGNIDYLGAASIQVSSLADGPNWYGNPPLTGVPRITLMFGSVYQNGWQFGENKIYTAGYSDETLIEFLETSNDYTGLLPKGNFIFGAPSGITSLRGTGISFVVGRNGKNGPNEADTFRSGDYEACHMYSNRSTLFKGDVTLNQGLYTLYGSGVSSKALASSSVRPYVKLIYLSDEADDNVHIGDTTNIVGAIFLDQFPIIFGSSTSDGITPGGEAARINSDKSSLFANNIKIYSGNLNIASGNINISGQIHTTVNNQFISGKTTTAKTSIIGVDDQDNIVIGDAICAGIVLNSNASISSLGTINRLSVGGGDIFTGIKSITAALNFGSVTAQTSKDLNINLAGAVPGDCVWLGNPTGIAGFNYSAFVSGNNQVTVRMNNYSANPIVPQTGLFRVSIVQF